MYDRDEKNRLIVKAAWAIPHLPMAIIVELPDGQLKRFGVLQQDYFERHEMTFRARLPRDEDLHEYKGYHPKTIPTAHVYGTQEAAVYGLYLSAAATLRAIPSEARTQASRDNGKKGGRPKKITD